METQFILDLHEKSHAEFRTTYGAPISLVQFLQMRAESANAYLTLYLGEQQVLVDNDLNNVAIPLSNTESLDQTLTDPNSRYNVLLGHGAGASSTGMKYSTFIGYNVANAGANLSWNVIVGAEAGKVLATGTNNTIIGSQAATTKTSGDNNVLIGYNVNPTVSNGNGQVIIGAEAQADLDGANQIAIGYQVQGQGANTTTIGTDATTHVFLWASDAIVWGTLSAISKIARGYGSPEGVLPGRIGDLYSNLSGGPSTTLYVKTSGNGTNTGWTAK